MIGAADNGHLAVVQLLVSSGADTSIQDTVSYIYTTSTLYNKHDDVMMMTMTCTASLVPYSYPYLNLIFLHLISNFLIFVNCINSYFVDAIVACLIR